jgi:hypothetical protein
MRACTRQPVGVTRVDWGHSFFGGKGGYVYVGGSRHYQLPGGDYTIGSGAIVTGVASGIATTHGSSSMVTLGPHPTWTLPVSLVCIGYLQSKDASATNYTGLSVVANGAIQLGNGQYADPNNRRTKTWTASAASNPFSAKVTSVGAAGVVVFDNGKLAALADSGLASTYVTNTGTNIQLGYNPATSGYVAAGSHWVALYALSNIAANDAVLQSLSINPWQLFAQPPQWLYTGMGSGSWTPIEVTG